MKPVSLPLLAFPVLLALSQNGEALDSYRYLHVTIDTPWSIFLFLLIGIFAPFILTAVLVWRHSGQKKPEPSDNKPPEPSDS